MGTSRAELRARYSTSLLAVEALQRHVDLVLRPFAESRGWLYASRVKGPDSYLQKLETGGWASAALDDLLGCTVVVPTLKDIESCISSLPARVNVDPKLSKRTASRQKDPDVFRFDDERLICRLGPPAALGRTRGTIWENTFELQVKTITQYAWGTITHPLVYKRARYDWRTARLSAQLRALAEQADLIYAEFSTVATRIGARTSKRSGRLDVFGQNLDSWVADDLVDTDQLPPSIVRFAESGANLVDSLGLDPVKVCRAVRDELATRGLGRSISLFQLVLGVSVTTFGASVDWGRIRNYRALITSELEDRFPALRVVPESVRVDLRA